MIWYFGLNGLIVGVAIGLMIMLYLFYSKMDRKPVLRINFDIWPYLIRVGFPIMLSGLLFQLLISVDKIMILKFFDKIQLGYYSLGLTILNMVCNGFISIGFVISPHLLEKYAETENIDSIKNYITKPILARAYLAPLVLVPLYFFSDLIYFQFLSEYSPGYKAFHILLLGGFFIIISSSLTGFFVAINKRMHYVFIQVSAIIIAFIANYLAIRLGNNITSVAIATTIVMFIYAIVLIGYVMFHYSKEIVYYLRFLGTIFLPLTYSLLILYLGHIYDFGITSGSNSLVQSLSYTGIFFVVYLPITVFGFKLVFK